MKFTTGQQVKVKKDVLCHCIKPAREDFCKSATILKVCNNLYIGEVVYLIKGTGYSQAWYMLEGSLESYDHQLYLWS